MNLLNEKAKHTKFGTGVIKSLENDVIRIQFDEAIGEKAFVYPDSFEKFLKIENASLKKEIKNDLKARMEQKELEKERQRMESERQEKERREALEKDKPKSRGRKTGTSAKSAPKQKQ